MYARNSGLSYFCFLSHVTCYCIPKIRVDVNWNPNVRGSIIYVLLDRELKLQMILRCKFVTNLKKVVLQTTEHNTSE